MTGETIYPVRRLGIRDLEVRTGRERSTIRRWIAAGKFPAPHFLGTRRCWLLSEIEQWESAVVTHEAPANNLKSARPVTS